MRATGREYRGGSGPRQAATRGAPRAVGCLWRGVTGTSIDAVHSPPGRSLMTDSRPASAFAGTSAASLTAALDFLSQLTQVVASNTELQPILDWMVEKTTTLLSADEGSIRLVDPAMTSAPQTMVRKPRAGLESGSWEPAVSMSVMGFLLIKQETLNSADLLADPRFTGLKNVQ